MIYSSRLKQLCLWPLVFTATRDSQALDNADQSTLKPLLLKARALSFSNQPSAAVAIYKQVLAKDPNNSEAYAGLGWVYYQAHKIPAAIAYEKKSIELDPLNAEPHYYLAAIYMSQKHYQTATNEHALAIKLAKDRPCNCGQQSQLLKNLNSEARQ